MTSARRHSRQGGRALPTSRRPKAPLEPAGRSPHRGAREAGERGRAGARGRIGDPRGARAQPRALEQRALRGDREDALLLDVVRLAAAAAAELDAEGARHDLHDDAAVRFRAAAARVEADGDGVAQLDRVGVDRRARDNDAVGFAVGVVVRAGAGA